MKLLFRQRLFSWFDSYDIYDESGATVFTVKGRLSWGHKLEIYDNASEHIGTIKEEIFRFLPTFNMYIGNSYMGKIRKEFTFFKPKFTLDYQGWEVNGNIWEWNYLVVNSVGQEIMRAEKQLFNWTDTYTIDIINPADTLVSLMIVLAIDAAKCSNDS
jgi:Uncharacterized conserved protein